MKARRPFCRLRQTHQFLALARVVRAGTVLGPDGRRLVRKLEAAAAADATHHGHDDVIVQREDELAFDGVTVIEACNDRAGRT